MVVSFCHGLSISSILLIHSFTLHESCLLSYITREVKITTTSVNDDSDDGIRFDHWSYFQFCRYQRRSHLKSKCVTYPTFKCQSNMFIFFTPTPSLWTSGVWTDLSRPCWTEIVQQWKTLTPGNNGLERKILYNRWINTLYRVEHSYLLFTFNYFVLFLFETPDFRWRTTTKDLHGQLKNCTTDIIEVKKWKVLPDLSTPVSNEQLIRN